MSEANRARLPYYTLAYAPTNTETADKYWRIDVSVPHGDYHYPVRNSINSNQQQSCRCISEIFFQSLR